MEDPRTPGERAADEWAVRNTITRIAQYADGLGSVDEYAGLFTEDAEWLMPGAERHGRDDIRAGSAARREAGGVGPGSNTRHMVTSVAVDFPGPDEAVVDSYWIFLVDTLDNPRIQMLGHYHDTVRRTPDGWLLARREINYG
jgi:uncharacterized protein (TIGR02246 family)